MIVRIERATLSYRAIGPRPCWPQGVDFHDPLAKPGQAMQRVPDERLFAPSSDRSKMTLKG
jgi:hypothetical protein